MSPRAQPDVHRIVVSRGRVDQSAHWEFRGKVFHGAIHHYAALDANTIMPIPWWLILCVPRDLRKGGYVLLQALDFPRTEAWTPIARTVINFAKATMQGYRGMLYAKIRLADPMSPQRYENVAWGIRSTLPPYLAGFRLRAKRKVATTRGSDADSLVAVVPRDDHAGMIRLFFATKAWPLDKGLPAATRRALSGARAPAA